MMKKPFPVIDPVATGANIVRRVRIGDSLSEICKPTLALKSLVPSTSGRLAKAFRPSTTCTLSVPCSM